MTARKRLLQQLVVGGGSAIVSAQSLKVHTKTFQRALSDLMEEGAVERCLRITDAGRQELERLVRIDAQAHPRSRVDGLVFMNPPTRESLVMPRPDDAEIERIRRDAIAARALMSSQEPVTS